MSKRFEDHLHVDDLARSVGDPPVNSAMGGQVGLGLLLRR